MSPVYVFRCSTCEAIEERLQVGFTPINPRCEKCGPYMQLQVTAASVTYKGGGWAKKDKEEKK